MSRVKQVCVGVLVAAVVLLFVGVERAWFAAEPAWRGKTVTEWLDRLVLYELQTNSAGISEVPRSPEDLAGDPALAAILRLGAKATPILVARIQERAHWDPADGGTRAMLWLRWAWNRIRHTPTSPPAPEGWSEFQRRRKNAAAFALLALGTNANAGFHRLIEVYADAPKHQSVSGTRIPGPPVGVYPSLVTSLARQALPQRDEEMIGDVLRGLKHTNGWCRIVAAQCVSVFPEHLWRTKGPLFRLLQDENEVVREAALGQLLWIVQQPKLHQVVSPAEVAGAASAVIDDVTTSERLRTLAETVLRHAADAGATGRAVNLAQPGGRDGSQPIRSETNGTSSATSSRR